MTILDFNTARRAKLQRDYEAARCRMQREIVDRVMMTSDGQKRIDITRSIIDRDMPVLREYRKQLRALA